MVTGTLITFIERKYHQDFNHFIQNTSNQDSSGTISKSFESVKLEWKNKLYSKQLIWNRGPLCPFFAEGWETEEKHYTSKIVGGKQI